MGRSWWTVWVKVAILAVILILAYTFVSREVKDTFEPYLLDNTSVSETEEKSLEEEEALPKDETQDGEEADAEQSGADMIKSIAEKIENKVGVYIDYENFIFDYANGYAQKMMEESREERNIITESLS